MRYLLIFSLGTLLLACTKPDDPVQPADKRDIAGTITVFDEFGKPSNDVIGITVTLSDGVQAHTTQTIQGGRYSFDQLAAGSYQLTAAKSGYGTMKWYGIDVRAVPDSAHLRQQIPAFAICERSTTTITELSGRAHSDGSISWSMKLSPSPKLYSTPRYYRLFLGEDSLVSPGHCTVIFPSLPSDGTAAGSTASGSFRDAFPPGSKVWLRIYGDSYTGNGYKDTLTKQYVFPCLNPVTAPAVSFIMQ